MENILPEKDLTQKTEPQVITGDIFNRHTPNGFDFSSHVTGVPDVSEAFKQACLSFNKLSQQEGFAPLGSQLVTISILERHNHLLERIYQDPV